MRSVILMAMVLALILPAVPAAADAVSHDVGLVDTSQGYWWLQSWDGGVKGFFYGNPGDYPFVGDWNCDGIDTVGLYRQSDGYAYLRNVNSQGVADIRFFFGDPGDVPIPGDFDGDGCDTLSIYRPSEQRFYIINELGENDGGLGAADYWFSFGNPGDTPFSGDFDGDGTTEIGLHRATTGLVYFEDELKVNGGGGVADHEFFFGDPGDRFVTGDWNADGADSPGLYRPSNWTFYFRYTNTQGVADETSTWGHSEWMPVGGVLGIVAGHPEPPQPPPPLVTFGAGTHLVPSEVPAGRYITGGGSGCYAERLSGLGGELGDIIANVFVGSAVRVIVDLDGTEVAFKSDGDCGTWTNQLSARSDPSAEFGGGHWVVGDDITPGLWRNSDSSGACYWERLGGFSWELGDIIANEFTYDISTVQIHASDEGFWSGDCGTWTKIG